MKKNQTSKNKKFYTILIKNYILFTASTIFIIFIILIIAIFKLLNLAYILSENHPISSQISTLKNGQYKKINISNLQKQNGWIEVLDKNYKVIYSKGTVKEKRISYTKQELNAITDPESNNYDMEKYNFKSNTGENLILISKIPNRDISGFASNELVKYIKNSFSQLSTIFITLYIINIILFILWLNKKVKRPLYKINKSMDLFTKTNKEIYIDYNGEEEFVQICTSFNTMVKKLKKIEKEKSILEDSKQIMLANISHDLKNPITTVQGYAKAILEGYVTDKNDINKYLNIIYKKSTNITELINLLFEYVKLEHPDFKLNLKLDDLSELTREIVAENYEHIDDCKFTLNYSIPNKKLLYNFDKNQLKRAISNLISNSLKYNKAGTTLNIILKNVELHYIIIIADNGIGIPKNVQKQLFTPFVMGNFSKDVSTGTGLGLSITKQIIDKHNGQIKLITSNNSRFSTEFEIKLPKFKNI